MHSSGSDGRDYFEPFTGVGHRLREDVTEEVEVASSVEDMEDTAMVVEGLHSENLGDRCDEMRLIAGGINCKLEDAPPSDTLIAQCDEIITGATLLLSEIDGPYYPKKNARVSKAMKKLEQTFCIVVAAARDRNLIATTNVHSQQEQAPAPMGRWVADLPSDDASTILNPELPKDVAEAVATWDGQSSQLDDMCDDIFGVFAQETTQMIDDSFGETQPPPRKRRTTKGKESKEGDE